MAEKKKISEASLQINPNPETEEAQPKKKFNPSPEEVETAAPKKKFNVNPELEEKAEKTSQQSC